MSKFKNTHEYCSCIPTNLAIISYKSHSIPTFVGKINMFLWFLRGSPTNLPSIQRTAEQIRSRLSLVAAVATWKTSTSQGWASELAVKPDETTEGSVSTAV